jgi:hypothetical protein
MSNTTTALRYDSNKIQLHHYIPAVFNYRIAELDPGIITINHIMNFWFYDRCATGLLKLDLINPDTAAVLTYGANKYSTPGQPGDLNYSKGMQYSRVLNSFRRHVLAIANGELNDPESGLPHINHAKCNALFALTYHLSGFDKTDFDDRPVPNFKA